MLTCKECENAPQSCICEKPAFNLPTITEMKPIPPNSNPFHYDQWNMGCDISGAWVAMFNEHAGLKQEHNLTKDEKVRKARGECIFYDDPKYIIMANRRTGQRFQISFE